jgi:DNA-binding GntR family transcriptional regulator
MTSAARFQRIYTALRTRICLLDHPPGTKLSEDSLASEFGTSRTPVRRVLARLEDEGLVESRHGIGTLVMDVDIREMTQVYDLRMELAQLSAGLSPRPVSATMLNAMHLLVARGAALQANPDARDFAELNMDFHAFALGLTGNAALRDVTDRLYFLTARIWLKAIPQMDLEIETAIFLDELRQTRAALEVGDLHAAALIRRAHISMSFKRLSGF